MKPKVYWDGCRWVMQYGFIKRQHKTWKMAIEDAICSWEVQKSRERVSELQSNKLRFA